MMKVNITFIFFITSFCFLNAQSVLGTWKTIDDETGEEKSIVKIYKEKDKIYGKIIEILNPKKNNPVCSKCKGKHKNKPILGMIIIDGLTKDDEVYEGGKILNPSNGKIYKCRIKLDEDNSNKLQVRGYVGFFYKTQYWERVN